MNTLTYQLANENKQMFERNSKLIRKDEVLDRIEEAKRALITVNTIHPSVNKTVNYILDVPISIIKELATDLSVLLYTPDSITPYYYILLKYEAGEVHIHSTLVKPKKISFEEDGN